MLNINYRQSVTFVCRDVNTQQDAHTFIIYGMSYVEASGPDGMAAYEQVLRQRGIDSTRYYPHIRPASRGYAPAKAKAK